MFTTRGMPMMGQKWIGTEQSAQQGEKSADQQKEEAEGKALFDQLKAKQTTCAKLTDDDFELIGEYVMGQRTGASHEQMNAMLKQMMGDIGEAQMHIVLGKSATGCATGTAAAGMMDSTGSPRVGGAGMMR
jgi:NACalpha-BTF3-like transcription factor